MAATLRGMADERRSTRLLCGQIYFREPGMGDDEAIAGLAGLQHGVVARRQLLELGLSADAIDYRLATGRLRKLFPGARAAYAVGHEALTLAARATAAVITAGPGTAASHWTALALNRLLERPRPLIHVTCAQRRTPRRGLFIYRAHLAGDQMEVVDGVPVTGLPRTFLDLSASCDERQLRTLIKRAEFRKLLQVGEVVEILERYPRRRGRGALARVVAGFAVTGGTTQSPLEDDFLEFCGGRGIPLPETDVSIQAGGRTRIVDCLWRDARLVVELDGRDAHMRELAFEEDRARDRALTASGWRPVRVTSAQLHLGTDELEADLRTLLGLDERRSTRPGAG
jgi:predicted transcriptional regulator of viral defense system